MRQPQKAFLAACVYESAAGNHARANTARRKRGSRRFAFFLFFFGTLQAAANAKGRPSYPEKGTVVAVRVDERTDFVPHLSSGSKGRTHGGEAFVHRKQVYRVETDDRIYELGGGKDPLLAVGDAVEFRIEKETAHVRAGNKEEEIPHYFHHAKSEVSISTVWIAKTSAEYNASLDAHEEHIGGAVGGVPGGDLRLGFGLRFVVLAAADGFRRRVRMRCRE